MINVKDRYAAVEIGVEDTNRARRIPLDISAWVAEYPDDMVYEALFVRPGEGKEDAYPVLTERDGNILYWIVKYRDTEKAGQDMGKLSIHGHQPNNEDGIYVKSVDIPVRVIGSDVGTGHEPPEEEPAWIVQVLDAKEAAMGAAAQAAESVEHYPQIGENGNWYVWDAETEAFVDTEYPARGAQGEQGEQGPQGPQGEQGAAGPQGEQGEQGAQGNPGSDGQDGVSPAVTVTEITGGHSVKITDAAHPDGQTFQVMDGEQGEKGEDGDDAPQIDDTQASADHPWSGQKISQDLSEKAEKNQGASNAGTVMTVGINGVIFPKFDGMELVYRHTVTASEEVQVYSITKDNDGASFNLDAAIIYVVTPIASVASNLAFNVVTDGYTYTNTIGSFTSTSNIRYGGIFIDIKNKLVGRIPPANTGNTTYFAITGQTYTIYDDNQISKITSFKIVNGSAVIDRDTVIYILGRRRVT